MSNEKSKQGAQLAPDAPDLEKSDLRGEKRPSEPTPPPTEENATAKRRGRKKGCLKSGGRKKGTPNKVTASVRQWLAQFVTDQIPTIEADIKTLPPKDRVFVWERLLQYVTPKRQAVTAGVSFESLTDEQLEQIVSELTRGGEL